MLAGISTELDYMVISLNRPESLNALNRQLLSDLESAVSKASSSYSTRAVIFVSTSKKAFCAGADLKERLSMSIDETRASVKRIGTLFSSIEKLPMPTIAAIEGIAFGGGLELALACDMRIMHEHAKVGLTECSLGIIPGAGGTQRLQHIVGVAKAKEMIFRAAAINAYEAEKIGLANFVVRDSDNVLNKAKEWATEIAANGPIATKAAKTSIDGYYLKDIEDNLHIESDSYEKVLMSKDRIIGLQAFASKQKPLFIGE